MKYSRNIIEEDELVKNPTSLSMHVIHLAKKAQAQYQHLLQPQRFTDRIKLHLWYLRKHEMVYEFIKRLKERPLPDNPEDLFTQLESSFEVIAMNNLLLTYAFVLEGDKRNPIITREDQKLLYFRELYHNHRTPTEFKDQFGHYALNPFELSARRFQEYTDMELQQISRLLADFELHKTVSLEEYLNKIKKDRLPLFTALREELRYTALSIVSRLRTTLLKLQDTHGFKDIFEMSYDELRSTIPR